MLRQIDRVKLHSRRTNNKDVQTNERSNNFSDSDSNSSESHPNPLQSIDLIDEECFNGSDRMKKDKPIDYDLSTDIQTSQNMFEMRLIKAETPVKNFIRINQNSGMTTSLDLSVACGPEEFSQEWDSLSLGYHLKQNVEKLPLLKELHDHFEQNRIFIIASGVIGEGIMKLFLIAQHEGSRCLMELEFDPSNKNLAILFKAHNHEKIRFFQECLQLSIIFGDVIEENECSSVASESIGIDP